MNTTSLKRDAFCLGYNGFVRTFLQKFSISILFVFSFGLFLGIYESSFGYVSAVSAQVSDVRVEPVRTRSQAQEIISKLDSEIGAQRTKLKVSEDRLLGIKADVESSRVKLVKIQRKSAAPAVDAFILQDQVDEVGQEPNDQLRSKYLAAQAVISDNDATARIREAQLEFDLGKAQLDVLESSKEDLESQIAEVEIALETEQGLLGKIYEKSVHERGREGSTTALVVTQSVGTKPGFLLATCPVEGPHNYIDSYGAKRPTRRGFHIGVDIMAPQGTPVVAPVSGRLEVLYDNGRGFEGNYFRLFGDTGAYYLGLHLHTIVGESRRVEAGELIGTVGQTGAPGSGDHLHFEIHPNGKGAYINPTLDTRRVCSGYQG